MDEELDPRSWLREYVDSKRKLVAKKLCYAKPTRSAWLLKQGRMGDLSQLKEDLEQKITEKFIVFSALCFCFSCCLLLL